MDLENKKKLAAKTLKVGVGRIKLDVNRLDEIKEAITKQDVRELFASGAIMIKPISGRITKEKRKTRKRIGKVKLKVNKRKENYVIITRKLRAYIKELKLQDKLTVEKYKQLRKQIKMKTFRSKRHIKESI